MPPIRKLSVRDTTRPNKGKIANCVASASIKPTTTFVLVDGLVIPSRSMQYGLTVRTH
jgi:hypothetical protein